MFDQQHSQLTALLSAYAVNIVADDMVTVEVLPNELLAVCELLRDDEHAHYTMLLDLCGVDYQEYGMAQWRTHEVTATGYDRAVSADMKRILPWDRPRYAVVYHLLSIENNQRLRIKVYLDAEQRLPSVNAIWPAANWYEREAYDLFGIIFEGHPDLRRILTDYGFVGHPLRKDFPLSGEVEIRYDAANQCCVYEPVSIEPRVLVPKVIRTDNRNALRMSKEAADE